MVQKQPIHVHKFADALSFREYPRAVYPFNERMTFACHSERSLRSEESLTWLDQRFLTPFGDTLRGASYGMTVKGYVMSRSPEESFIVLVERFLAPKTALGMTD